MRLNIFSAIILCLLFLNFLQSLSIAEEVVPQTIELPKEQNLVSPGIYKIDNQGQVAPKTIKLLTPQNGLSPQTYKIYQNQRIAPSKNMKLQYRLAPPIGKVNTNSTEEKTRHQDLPPESTPENIEKDNNGDIVQRYFAIWKELMMSKNNISSEWFDEHIKPLSMDIKSNTFKIYYKLTIAWATFNLNDKFPVHLKEGRLSSYNFPTEEYLSLEMIRTIINDYDILITKITPFDSLKYHSEQDALRALANVAGVSSMELSMYKIRKSMRSVNMNGNLYLNGRGIINEYTNECVKGQINLVTGESMTWKYPCVIN